MKTETREQLKTQISIMIRLANACDLEMLQDIEKEYKNEVSRYEAIGILDGNPNYYKRLESREAYYKRIKAITNLVEVLHETDKQTIRE